MQALAIHVPRWRTAFSGVSFPGRRTKPADDRGSTKKVRGVSDPPFRVRPRGMEAILDQGSSSATTGSATAKTWTARILGSLLVLFLLVDAMSSRSHTLSLLLQAAWV